MEQEVPPMLGFIQGTSRPSTASLGADAVLFTIIHHWEKVRPASKIEIDVDEAAL